MDSVAIDSIYGTTTKKHQTPQQSPFKRDDLRNKLTENRFRYHMQRSENKRNRHFNSMMQPVTSQRSPCTSNGDDYAISVENTANSQSFNQKFTSPRTVKNSKPSKFNFGNLSMNASTTNTRMSRVQQKLENI